MKWDEIKFKAARGNQSSGGDSGGSGGSTAAAPKRQFGVSRDGKTLTNAYVQISRVQYSRIYNLSKWGADSENTKMRGRVITILTELQCKLFMTRSGDRQSTTPRLMHDFSC